MHYLRKGHISSLYEQNFLMALTLPRWVYPVYTWTSVSADLYKLQHHLYGVVQSSNISNKIISEKHKPSSVTRVTEEPSFVTRVTYEEYKYQYIHEVKI